MGKMQPPDGCALARRPVFRGLAQQPAPYRLDRGRMARLARGDVAVWKLEIRSLARIRKSNSGCATMKSGRRGIGHFEAKVGVTLSDTAYTRPRQSVCVFYGTDGTICPTT